MQFPVLFVCSEGASRFGLAIAVHAFRISVSFSVFVLSLFMLLQTLRYCDERYCAWGTVKISI